MELAKLRNYNQVDNTRQCKCCKEWKDLSEFSTRVFKNKAKLQVREICKNCSLKNVGKTTKYRTSEFRNNHRKGIIEKVLLSQAKTRAKSKQLDFDIDVTDLVVPTICPLLKIPIIIGRNKATKNSPSVDRIDSTKGYVKGNVWIISHRANSIKNDASLEELQLITENLGSCIKRKNCKNAEMPTCSRASGKTEEGSETKDTTVSLKNPPLEIVMT